MAILDRRLIPFIEMLAELGMDWLAFELMEGIRLGREPVAREDELARLRQLGPLTDDNLLIFRDRTPKGRHYTARPRDPPTGLQDSSFGAGCFGNAKSS